MLKAAKIITVSLAVLMTVVLIYWRTEMNWLPSPWDEDLGMLILILQPVAMGFNFYIGRKTTGGWKRFALIYTIMIVLMIFGFAAMVTGIGLPGSKD